MLCEVEQESEGTEATIKVYKKRWLFLAAFLLIIAIQSFCRLILGVFSNVSVQYFNITYAQADWLLVGYSLGAILAMPFFAWAVYGRRINLRQFSLFGISCSITNYICQILSLWLRSYPFSFVGSMLGGIGLQALYYIPPKFSAVWFPEKQIGIATASFYASISLANILALSISPIVLFDPPQPFSITRGTLQNMSDYSTYRNLTDLSHTNVNSSRWFVEDQKILLAFFWTSFCLSLVIYVLLFIFMPIHPKLPPSVAEASKRTHYDECSKQTISIKNFFVLSQKLLVDKIFLSYTIAYCILFCTFAVNDIFIQQLIEPTLIQLHIKQPPDRISGYILPCYSAGALVGGISGGKVIDRYKQYRLQSIVGSFLAFVCVLGSAISSFFYQLIPLGFCYVFFGFSVRLGMIPMYDAIMQHIYPMDPLFVSVWLIFFMEGYILVSVELARILFIFVGSNAVLIYESGLFFVAVLLSVFVKPKLNRLNKENEDICNEELHSENAELLCE